MTWSDDTQKAHGVILSLRSLVAQTDAAASLVGRNDHKDWDWQDILPDVAPRALSRALTGGAQATLGAVKRSTLRVKVASDAVSVHPDAATPKLSRDLPFSLAVKEVNRGQADVQSGSGETMTTETDRADAFSTEVETATESQHSSAAPLVLGAASRVDIDPERPDVSAPSHDETPVWETPDLNATGLDARADVLRESDDAAAFFESHDPAVFYAGEELDASLTLEARIAELEAAVGSYAGQFEPDGSEDLASETPSAMILSYPARTQVVPEEPRGDAGVEAPQDSERFEHDEERIAQILSFVTARYMAAPEDVAPPAQDAPQSPIAQLRESVSADGHPDEPLDAEPDTLVEVHDWLDAEITDEVVELAELHALAAATLIEADEIEGVEDEGVEDETGALTAPEDRAEAPLEIDFDSLEANETDDDEEADAAGYADDILDEMALRDLITEIIREELQATLGERITRNVRRLVKREVQRALTLKDFE